MLNNIVDNLEQCGQQNIVQCCFHQARTGCAFFAVYVNNTLPLVTDLYMKLHTELGRLCLDLCTKPVSFITHFLMLCGVKMKDFKSFNISQRELENFCHGLKGNLEEQDVRFWKD